MARGQDHGLFREAEENWLARAGSICSGAAQTLRWSFGATQSGEAQRSPDAARRGRAQPRVRSKNLSGDSSTGKETAGNTAF